jgi:hypothetical protein
LSSGAACLYCEGGFVVMINIPEGFHEIKNVTGVYRNGVGKVLMFQEATPWQP